MLEALKYQTALIFVFLLQTVFYHIHGNLQVKTGPVVGCNIMLGLLFTRRTFLRRFHLRLNLEGSFKRFQCFPQSVEDVVLTIARLD